MRQTVRGTRALGAVVLAGVVALSATGCFGKGARDDFALPADQRPLEIPPAMVAGQGGGAAPAAAAARPTVAAAAAAGGFTVAGERDAVFERLGHALATVDGVTIASRAQLLGSYDVAYQGEDFLVRAVAVDAGIYISAVDPRGMPATGAAPTALLGQLQAQLAR